MQSQIRLRLLVFSLVLCLAALAVVPAAQACVQPQRPVAWIIPHEICCPWGGGPCVIRVWVIIHGYTTFGAGPGQVCGAALTDGGPILAVNGASVNDADTGERIPGFSFNPNATTSSSAEQTLALTPTTTDPDATQSAAGFSADVSRTVTSGTNVDVMFDLEIDENTSLEELREYLESEGVVVTGEVDSTGEFTGHIHAEPIERAEVQDDTPTTMAVEPAPVVGGER